MRLAAVVAVGVVAVAAAVVAAGSSPTASHAELYWNNDSADLAVHADLALHIGLAVLADLELHIGLAVLADLALRIGLAALVDCPAHTCRLDCPVLRRALFGHRLRHLGLGLGLDLCLRGYLYS